jgi:hypothetical protein
MLILDRPQMRIKHGECALHAGKLRLHTHTHTHTHTLRIRNTFCFSTAVMVTRTRLIVTLYVHCLTCLNVIRCSQRISRVSSESVVSDASLYVITP